MPITRPGSPDQCASTAGTAAAICWGQTLLDKNAFVSPAAFTYGNTPRTNVLGLHNPNTYTESLSLRREFQLRENVKLAFQADAFNPFNWVVFAGPTIAITSSSFGKITATSSTPRV